MGTLITFLVYILIICIMAFVAYVVIKKAVKDALIEYHNETHQ